MRNQLVELIFLGKKSAGRGNKITIDENVELEYQGTLIRLAEGFPQTIKLI